MVDASHVVAEVVVSVTMSITAMSVTVVTMIVVVRIVVRMRMIPVVVMPSPIMSVPIVGAIPVIVVIPGVVITVVGRNVETEAEGIKAPVPGVAYINIGAASGTATTSIVVIVIIQCGAGSSAETLDACRIVGIVVGFCGGIDYSVGVGHGFGGLIHWLRVGLVVPTVSVIGLVVISGNTCAWGDGAAVVANL